MSDLVPNYVNFPERRGERIERVVEIYANADAVRGQDLKEVTEDINVKKNLQTKHTGGTAWGRCCSLTAVSVLLLLLCVLLLTVITVLLLKNNKLDTEKKQFQSSYNAMNTERERLQTSYDKMRLQINQLQFQKDQLLLQRGQFEQQKSNLKNVLLKLGCGFFSSSIYYISNVKKAWSESRQDCINNGADLVIINSTEEQEFISKRFGKAEAWIGLSDTEIEGNFKWVDGTLLTTPFWWTREPNDYGGNEDCAITGYKSATSNISTWADFPCNFPVFGICEMKIFN